MSVDKNPTPVPSDRPADPLTSKDAARLYNMLEGFARDSIDRTRDLSARLANVQSHQLDILELLSRIESGASSSRAGRIDAELREAELEREVAEKNLKALEAKLEIKKGVKDKTLDTQENIVLVASSTYADLEAKRKAEHATWITDLRRGAIKAVVGALSVSGTFGLLAFLWWLFQNYVNRAGP